MRSFKNNDDLDRDQYFGGDLISDTFCSCGQEVYNNLCYQQENNVSKQPRTY